MKQPLKSHCQIVTNKTISNHYRHNSRRNGRFNVSKAIIRERRNLQYNPSKNHQITGIQSLYRKFVERFPN